MPCTDQCADPTDREANAVGVSCTCNSVPLSVVSCPGVTRDPRGVVKMILEAATRRLVGVAMVGTDTAEALKITVISFTRDVETLNC